MRGVWLLCALLALPGVARAEGMFDLPPGWFTARQGEVTTCLEVMKDHKLRLTFQGRMDRNPVVVDGDYQVSATKMADYHATFKVTKVWQKQLGRVIKAGDALTLTLHYECAGGHPQVQLCLHDAKVVCRNLQDPRNTCKEGPAIDGSQINAPPKRPSP